jgi:hypothetical protein
MAAGGMLGQVTRCVICKKWFVANRLKHQACSPNCRHKQWERKPEVLESRAKRAGEKYDLVRQEKISRVKNTISEFHAKTRRKGQSVEDYILAELGLHKRGPLRGQPDVTKQFLARAVNRGEIVL